MTYSFSNNIVAYLDPGSGSIFLYALAGIAVSFFFSMKNIFYKSLFFFRTQKDRSKNPHDINANIILHVEGPQYEHLFMPIANELGKRNIEFSYITQYPRDEQFDKLPNSCTHIEISDGLAGFAVLNKATAKLFLTTTPQLDVLMLKRSPNVEKYVNVLHAPTDSGTLEIYALDYFDAILCPGEFMFDEIRKIEKLRNLRPKKLFNTGVLYYDSLAKHVKNDKISADKKTVLVSPSWGKNSLFQKCGIEFLNDLSKSYNIIVRPHPQTKKSQPELFAKIQEKCSALNIQLDTAGSPINAMNKSDIMISDFSGIVYDYAFVNEKPVVVFDMNIELEGFEGHYLDKPLWRNKILGDIATVIQHDKIAELKNYIDKTLKIKASNLAKVRDAHIPNFSQSATVATDNILEIIQN